jgi:hypothetical protein
MGRIEGLRVGLMYALDIENAANTSDEDIRWVKA